MDTYTFRNNNKTAYVAQLDEMHIYVHPRLSNPFVKCGNMIIASNVVFDETGEQGEENIISITTPDGEYGMTFTRTPDGEYSAECLKDTPDCERIKTLFNVIEVAKQLQDYDLSSAAFSRLFANYWQFLHLELEIPEPELDEMPYTDNILDRLSSHDSYYWLLALRFGEKYACIPIPMLSGNALATVKKLLDDDSGKNCIVCKRLEHGRKYANQRINNLVLDTNVFIVFNTLSENDYEIEYPELNLAHKLTEGFVYVLKEVICIRRKTDGLLVYVIGVSATSCTILNVETGEAVFQKLGENRCICL